MLNCIWDRKKYLLYININYSILVFYPALLYACCSKVLSCENRRPTKQIMSKINTLPVQKNKIIYIRNLTGLDFIKKICISNPRENEIFGSELVPESALTSGKESLTRKEAGVSTPLSKGDTFDFTGDQMFFTVFHNLESVTGQFKLTYEPGNYFFREYNDIERQRR